MTDSKKPATGARQQRAAKPKPRGARKRPAQPQRAAVPGAPTGQPRSLPPLTDDLIAYFGGREMLDLIVEDCVPDDASKGDVLRLLLEARRLRADPLRRDVYLAREASRDGGGVGYTVAARRDALLAFAERQHDFRGFDADAVYAKDTYERVKPNGSGVTLRERAGVVHVRGGVADDDRGDLLFAWCAVERADRPVLFFEARMAEYMPADDLQLLDPEDPRKRYTNRWLVKVAMCWTLRELYGLSDVVGAEELGKRPAPLPDMREPAAPTMFADGPRDPIDTRIINAHRDAQALDALLWPVAKVSARIASAKALAAEQGGDPTVLDEARAELASEIERDVQAEQARRHDPAKLRKRLLELRAFDPSTLDEEDLRDYQTERDAVEAQAVAAGINVAAA